MRLARGFTLIELLITVVILGIIASIALPSYTSYLTRSKLVEAHSMLADLRVKQEQRFQDARTYSAALCALNEELGVAMDDPQAVAAAFVALLERPARERLLGMPERLFARLNQVVPGLVDRALRRQLPAIRRHARGEPSPPASQGVHP